jgi:hypothetical protein
MGCPAVVAFCLPDVVSSAVFGRILTVLMAICSAVRFAWLAGLSGIGLKVEAAKTDESRSDRWSGVLRPADGLRGHPLGTGPLTSGHVLGQGRGLTIATLRLRGDSSSVEDKTRR